MGLSGREPEPLRPSVSIKIDPNQETIVDRDKLAELIAERDRYREALSRIEDGFGWKESNVDGALDFHCARCGTLLDGDTDEPVASRTLKAVCAGFRRMTPLSLSGVWARLGGSMRHPNSRH